MPGCIPSLANQEDWSWHSCGFSLSVNMSFWNCKYCSYNVYSNFRLKIPNMVLHIVWWESCPQLRFQYNILNYKFEHIINKVLNLRYFNILKQFILKIVRNNLFFRNVTFNWDDHSYLCISCLEKNENRTHFVQCRINKTFLDTLFLWKLLD